MQQVFHLFVFASVILHGSVSNFCYKKSKGIQIKIKVTFRRKLKGRGIWIQHYLFNIYSMRKVLNE